MESKEGVYHERKILKLTRRGIAKILFGLSSVCKSLGKYILTKEKTIVCDALSLPGWFILDKCMIYQIPLENEKLVGFEWHTYSMPDEWCDTMDKMSGRGKYSGKRTS